jgi:hypothetical protein
MMNNMFFRYGLILTLILISAVIFSCALSGNVKTNDLTEKCTHCHGDKLQGYSNVKAYCGQCHDVTVPLAPENISDDDRKSAVTSEPHIHKIKNVFAGTPSCFFCHRKGDF